MNEETKSDSPGQETLEDELPQIPESLLPPRVEPIKGRSLPRLIKGKIYCLGISTEGEPHIFQITDIKISEENWEIKTIVVLERVKIIKTEKRPEFQPTGEKYQTSLGNLESRLITKVTNADLNNPSADLGYDKIKNEYIDTAKAFGLAGEESSEPQSPKEEQMPSEEKPVVPNETVPNETVPNETVPNETVPNETAPEGEKSREEAREVPQESLREESLPPQTNEQLPPKTELQRFLESLAEMARRDLGLAEGEVPQIEIWEPFQGKRYNPDSGNIENFRGRYQKLPITTLNNEILEFGGQLVWTTLSGKKIYLTYFGVDEEYKPIYGSPTIIKPAEIAPKGRVETFAEPREARGPTTTQTETPNLAQTPPATPPLTGARTTATEQRRAISPKHRQDLIEAAEASKPRKGGRRGKKKK